MDQNFTLAIVAFIIGAIGVPVLLYLLKSIGGSKDSTIRDLIGRIISLEEHKGGTEQRLSDVARTVELKIADSLRYIEVKVAENYVSIPRFDRFEHAITNSISGLHNKFDTYIAKTTYNTQ